MRVALVVHETRPVVEENLRTMGDEAAEAAEAGAALVVFPEAVLTGLVNNDDPAHDLPLGQAVPGPATDALGALARRHDLRLSMHPGQYTLLSTPNPTILAASVRDLAWHARFLDALGLDASAKLVTHVGGAYGDNDVSDEFYWAAAELFITTGNARYAERLQPSTSVDSFYWAETELPGVLSLATVPADHAATQRDAARQRIVAIADDLVNVIDSEGYNTPLTATEYVWGSNNTS